MNLKSITLGLLAGLAVLPSGASAQYQQHLPIPQAPDTYGPRFYVRNCYGLVYGPCYYLQPPFPPVQGAIFAKPIDVVTKEQRGMPDPRLAQNRPVAPMGWGYGQSPLLIPVGGWQGMAGAGYAYPAVYRPYPYPVWGPMPAWAPPRPAPAQPGPIRPVAAESDATREGAQAPTLNTSPAGEGPTLPDVVLDANLPVPSSPPVGPTVPGLPAPANPSSRQSQPFGFAPWPGFPFGTGASGGGAASGAPGASGPPTGKLTPPQPPTPGFASPRTPGTVAPGFPGGPAPSSTPGYVPGRGSPTGPMWHDPGQMYRMGPVNPGLYGYRPGYPIIQGYPPAPPTPPIVGPDMRLYYYVPGAPGGYRPGAVGVYGHVLPGGPGSGYPDHYSGFGLSTPGLPGYGGYAVPGSPSMGGGGYALHGSPSMGGGGYALHGSPSMGGGVSPYGGVWGTPHDGHPFVIGPDGNVYGPGGVFYGPAGNMSWWPGRNQAAVAPPGLGYGYPPGGQAYGGFPYGGSPGGRAYAGFPYGAPPGSQAYGSFPYGPPQGSQPYGPPLGWPGYDWRGNRIGAGNADGSSRDPESRFTWRGGWNDPDEGDGNGPGNRGGPPGRGEPPMKFGSPFGMDAPWMPKDGFGPPGSSSAYNRQTPNGGEQSYANTYGWDNRPQTQYGNPSPGPGPYGNPYPGPAPYGNAYQGPYGNPYKGTYGNPNQGGNKPKNGPQSYPVHPCARGPRDYFMIGDGNVLDRYLGTNQ